MALAAALYDNMVFLIMAFTLFTLVRCSNASIAPSVAAAFGPPSPIPPSMWAFLMVVIASTTCTIQCSAFTMVPNKLARGDLLTRSPGALMCEKPVFPNARLSPVDKKQQQTREAALPLSPPTELDAKRTHSQHFVYPRHGLRKKSAVKVLQDYYDNKKHITVTQSRLEKIDSAMERNNFIVYGVVVMVALLLTPDKLVNIVAARISTGAATATPFCVIKARRNKTTEDYL